MTFLRALGPLYVTSPLVAPQFTFLAKTEKCVQCYNILKCNLPALWHFITAFCSSSLRLSDPGAAQTSNVNQTGDNFTLLGPRGGGELRPSWNASQKEHFFSSKHPSSMQIGEMCPRRAEDKNLLMHLHYFVSALLIQHAGWHAGIFNIECLWQHFSYWGKWFLLHGELVPGNLSGTSWSLTYFSTHLLGNILKVEI